MSAETIREAVQRKIDRAADFVSLDPGAKTIYDEAVRCGADHEDALDAVFVAGYNVPEDW
jgi:hypothetical protein